MTRRTVIALMLCLGATPALGQQTTQMVVPRTPLTTEQQVAFDAIRDVRDSVVAASALLAGLNRDLGQKPASTLEEQARRINAQCAATERQRVASRKALAGQKFTDKDMAKGQKNMLASLDQLQKPLRTCQATWTPLGNAGKGEEVRGYGISRSKPIVAGFNDFERTVLSEAKRLKLPVREVLRAGPSPADAPAPVVQVKPRAS